MPLIETYLNYEEFIATGRVFWSEIEDGPTIFFHGTSQQSEKSIESGGIRPQSPIWSTEDIRSVIACYNEIGWAGEDRGGYGVLKGFSEADHVTCETPSVALSHTSTQAVLYTLRDWAGGEVARAIRRSLEDLDLFLVNKDVRKENLKRHQRHLDEDPWFQIVDPESKLDWLHERLRNMVMLRAKCNAAKALHRGGMVYAVLPQDCDFSGIQDQQGHTVRWQHGVSPDRLHAKVWIPPDLSERDYELARKSCGNRFFKKAQTNKAYILERQQTHGASS